MNNKPIYEQIEELKKRIEELEKLNEPATKSDELPFWMPKLHEKYWWINHTIREIDWSLHSIDSDVDQERFAIGNYFQSKELAQKHIDKLKLLEEIKQWRGKHDPESFKLSSPLAGECRYELVYNTESNKWDDYEMSDYKNPLAIYFSSYWKLTDCVEYFGNRLNLLLGDS
jgi:hypothetical protein